MRLMWFNDNDNDNDNDRWFDESDIKHNHTSSLGMVNDKYRVQNIFVVWTKV